MQGRALLSGLVVGTSLLLRKPQLVQEIALQTMLRGESLLMDIELRLRLRVVIHRLGQLTHHCIGRV
jgi:hypothetical protein